MSNIFGMRGSPEKERKIKEMQAGEVGYAVEWAYDQETGELNEEFTVGKKGGTASLRVECVKPGLYSISFEKPIYRNMFTGEMDEE